MLDTSYEYFGQYNFDGAIASANQAFEIASSSKDTAAIVRAEFYMEIASQSRTDNYDVDRINDYLQFFRDNNFKLDQARSILFLGHIYYYFGDVQSELAQYIEGMKIYEELGFEDGIADVHSDMSLMYYDQHDYEAAFANIRKAIEIDQKRGNLDKLHRDHNNYAIIFEDTGPIDSAIIIHKKALDYAYQNNDAYGIGISLSNLGNNYVISEQYNLAKEYLFKALAIRDSLGNNRGLAYTHNRIGKMYNKLGQLNKAKYHAEKASFHAEKTGELKVRRMSYGLLSDVAASQNDARTELYYFKKMTELEDSLQNSENTKELTKMILLHDFDKKSFADSIARLEEARLIEQAHQEEIRQKNRLRNYLAFAALFFLMIAGGLYSRWNYIRKSRDILAKEKERSENLLLNILPAEVAQELKDTGKAAARDFDAASILFTDFITFTQNSEKLSATELVEELNICFEAFDRILDKYNIEKIKTIGDAYMAAGGLPVPSAESVRNTVLAGLEMQKFIEDRKEEKLLKGEPAFEMRVGINTGPVVAGIVGTKKFQYDVWGDTVNTASRIENHGEAGKVNISRRTYELLKDEDDLTFQDRGKIRAKGKGEIEMYFVGKR